MITRFLWQGMGRNLRLFVLLVLAIGIALPLLNQLLPPKSAFHVPAWVLQLIGKYLCYASLALAVDSPPGAGRTFAVTVVCANPGDARTLSEVLNQNWQNWRPLLGFFGGGIGGQPSLGAALHDLTKTLNIKSDEQRMLASFSFSQEALKGLENAGPMGAMPRMPPRPEFNPAPPKR